MSSLSSLISEVRAGNVQIKDLIPHEPQKESKKRDWVKITAIVVTVIAGLVAAFAGLCWWGMFPAAIFGGTEGALFTLFGSVLVAASSGAFIYYKWKTGQGIF